MKRSYRAASYIISKGYYISSKEEIDSKFLLPEMDIENASACIQIGLYPSDAAFLIRWCSREYRKNFPYREIRHLLKRAGRRFPLPSLFQSFELTGGKVFEYQLKGSAQTILNLCPWFESRRKEAVIPALTMALNFLNSEETDDD